MGLVSIPTRTADSYGEAKTDPGSAVAERYQVRPSQYDRLADDVIELARVVGVQGSTDVGQVGTSSPTGTLRGIADAVGNGHPGRYYRDVEHWLYHAAGAPAARWDPGAGGLLTVSGAAGGYIEGALNLGALDYVADRGYPFRREHLPWLRFGIYLSSVAATGGELRVGFEDAGRANGWWVIFDADTSTKAQLYSTRGGVHKVTDLSTVTAGTWHDLRLWLYLDSGSYYPAAQMDGGTITTLTTQAIDSKDYKRIVSIDSGALAGQTARVRRLETRADFGA